MDHKGTKTQRELVSDQANHAARITVHAAFTVHAQLGPGLLESVYEKCLAHGIRRRGLVVEKQRTVSIEFEGLHLAVALRMDIVVDDCLVVEVKATGALLPVHKAQLLTYLKLTGYKLGLLINFNVPVIKDGINRIVC